MININFLKEFTSSFKFDSFFNTSESINYQIDYKLNNNDSTSSSIQNQFSEKDLYKKYKNKSNISKVQEKLNETKIYFLAKSIKVGGQELTVALPISSMDDLSNSAFSKTLTTRTALFQMKNRFDLMKKDLGIAEGTPGNRPFKLFESLESGEPFGSSSRVNLEDLKMPEKKNLEHLSDNEIDSLQSPKLSLRTELVLDENGEAQLQSYYVTEYEYDYAFLDNTIFTNLERYGTDPRNRNKFKRRKEDLFFNLKNSAWNNFWNSRERSIRIAEFEDLFLKNTDELLNKNLIPIFCSLEQAQDLLVTVIEEILEPYQNYTFPRKYVPLPITNLDSVDLSFSLKNLDRSYDEELYHNKWENIKDWLVRHRLLKSSTVLKSHYENYPSEFDKPSIYADYEYSDLNSAIFEEGFDLSNLDKQSRRKYKNQIKKISLSNAKRWLNKSDQLLMSLVGKTKIVSMGLGDFLEFWENNSKTLNGEVLFIPSSTQDLKTGLPFSSTKSLDKFYEYQKIFRSNEKFKERNNYKYEVIIPRS